MHHFQPLAFQHFFFSASVSFCLVLVSYAMCAHRCLGTSTVCWTVLTNLYQCYLPGCLCSCSDIVHIQNTVNRWCTCISGVVHVHRLFQNCNHKVPSQQVMYVHVVSSTGPQGVIIILNLLSLSFHSSSFFHFVSRHSHYNHTPTWSVQVISEDYRFGQLFYLVTMTTLDQR